MFERFQRLTLAVAVVFSCGGCATGEQSIPFKLQDNLVHVTTSINGQPLSSVLDSGTGGVILNYSTAEHLRLVKRHAVGSAPAGGDDDQPLTPVLVDVLKLGPMQLSPVNGFAMNLHTLARSAEFPIDALVGEPAFEKGIVKIDYLASKVTFRPSRAIPACRNAIPLKIVNGTPVVEVALQSKSGGVPVVLHLIVDLGTRRFAAIIGGPFLDSDVGRSLLKSGHPQQVGAGTSGAVAGVAVRASELQVGDHHFQNLEIGLTKDVDAFKLGFADGTLGAPLWNRGSITFDYPNRRLCLST